LSVSCKPITAAYRAKAIQDLADKINKLSYEERQRMRADRSGERWFEQMTEEEKGTFIEATMPTGFKQMITAFKELPEDKRRRTVDGAIRRLREQRERMASGSTAGGVGAILPEPSSSFRAVEAAVGRRDARSAWAETQKAAADFAVALKKLPASSDLAASALVINASRSDDAVALRKEQAARRAARASSPSAWTSRSGGDRRRIGGRDCLTSASVFDPVRAALALTGGRQARACSSSRPSAA
jgi:hypothetical protein